MGLETATYITDLVTSNPPSSDLRSQGDDHLRLLKAVLQATFPTASKAWYNPTTTSKTADFTIASTDMNKTFPVDTTSGSVSATLPSLASGDAGWECFFIKTNTGTNPVFVVPASGTLQSGGLASLTKTRRSIPGVRISCFWTGSAWIISRANNLPVGSCIEFHGSTLPTGYEWPNGQTLSSSANYPDYNSAMSTLVLLDKRGRVGIPLDNLGGSAASRVGTIITGTAVGNVGGTETVSLSLSQIPDITSTNPATLGISVTSTISTILRGNTSGAYNGGSTFSMSTDITAGSVTSTQTLAIGAVSVKTNSTSGSSTGGAHSNLQPSIMVTEIVVVE